MDEKGIVVLGGGLAGIAAGLESNGEVYEAENYFGGVATCDKSNGFTFDRGIHVLQTDNSRIQELFDDCGLDFYTVDRSAHIFAFGGYTAYPFQINSTGLPLGKRLQCVWSYLTRDKKMQPANYEQWMHQTIGTGFADTFLTPYSTKFWSVHPSEMTFEWTGNRVPTSSLPQVLRGAIVSRNTRVGTNATFRYPKGPDGYGEIAKAMANRLGENLHLGHKVVRVDPENRRVDFFNGSSVSYTELVNTIPIPEFAKLVTHVPETVQKAIDGLRTNSIVVVNLGIDRENISDKHWVHFPEDDFSFFRISFPANFSPDLLPAGTSAISAEVSVDPENVPDEADLIERVRKDLVRCKVLRDDDKVVTSNIFFIRYGYCIFDEHRRDAMIVIKKWFQEIDVIPCGRYGLWAYLWSHEAILSGLNCGKKAAKKLQANAIPEAMEAQA